MKRKKLYLSATVLALTLVCAYLCYFFVNKYQNISAVSANKAKDAKSVKLDGLELSRRYLYLIKGKQYNLDLQPEKFKNYCLYPDLEDYQDILRQYTKWSSSDKAVTVDRDGIVTAVHPGKAVVSVDLNGKIYRCEIEVLPEGTEEIPISYHNTLFTEELYHKIEKMELKPPVYTSREIRDSFRISSIYSFLAASNLELEEVITGPDSIRMGGSVLILHLKGGEKMGIDLGGISVTYEDKYYNCSYGENSDYGNGVDLAWEIQKMVFPQQNEEQQGKD